MIKPRNNRYNNIGGKGENLFFSSIRKNTPVKKIMSATIALIFLFNVACPPAYASRPGNYGDKSAFEAFAGGMLAGALTSIACALNPAAGAVSSVASDVTSAALYYNDYQNYNDPWFTIKIFGWKHSFTKGETLTMLAGTVTGAAAGYISGLASSSTSTAGNTVSEVGSSVGSGVGSGAGGGATGSVAVTTGQSLASTTATSVVATASSNIVIRIVTVLVKAGTWIVDKIVVASAKNLIKFFDALIHPVRTAGNILKAVKNFAMSVGNKIKSAWAKLKTDKVAKETGKEAGKKAGDVTAKAVPAATSATTNAASGAGKSILGRIADKLNFAKKMKEAMTAGKANVNPYFFYGTKGLAGLPLVFLQLAIDITVQFSQMVMREYVEDKLEDSGLDHALAEIAAVEFMSALGNSFLDGLVSTLYAKPFGLTVLNNGGLGTKGEVDAIKARDDVGNATVTIDGKTYTIQQLAGARAVIVDEDGNMKILSLEEALAAKQTIVALVFGDGTNSNDVVTLKSDISGAIVEGLANYMTLVKSSAPIYIWRDINGKAISENNAIMAGVQAVRNQGPGRIIAGVVKVMALKIFKYRKYADNSFAKTWKFALSQAIGSITGSAVDNWNAVGELYAGNPKEGNPYSSRYDGQSWWAAMKKVITNEAASTTDTILWAKIAEHYKMDGAVSELGHIAFSSVASGLVDATLRRDPGNAEEVIATKIGETKGLTEAEMAREHSEDERKRELDSSDGNHYAFYFKDDTESRSQGDLIRLNEDAEGGLTEGEQLNLEQATQEAKDLKLVFIDDKNYYFQGTDGSGNVQKYILNNRKSTGTYLLARKANNVEGDIADPNIDGKLGVNPRDMGTLVKSTLEDANNNISLGIYRAASLDPDVPAYSPRNISKNAHRAKQRELGSIIYGGWVTGDASLGRESIVASYLGSQANQNFTESVSSAMNIHFPGLQVPVEERSYASFQPTDERIANEVKRMTNERNQVAEAVVAAEQGGKIEGLEQKIEKRKEGLDTISSDADIAFTQYRLARLEAEETQFATSAAYRAEKEEDGVTVLGIIDEIADVRDRKVAQAKELQRTDNPEDRENIAIELTKLQNQENMLFDKAKSFVEAPKLEDGSIDTSNRQEIEKEINIALAIRNEKEGLNKQLQGAGETKVSINPDTMAELVKLDNEIYDIAATLPDLVKQEIVATSGMPAIGGTKEEMVEAIARNLNPAIENLSIQVAIKDALIQDRIAMSEAIGLKEIPILGTIATAIEAKNRHGSINSSDFVTGGIADYTVDRRIMHSLPLSDYTKEGVAAFIDSNPDGVFSEEAVASGKQSLEDGQPYAVVSTYNPYISGIAQPVETYGNKQTLAVRGSIATLSAEFGKLRSANQLVKDFGSLRTPQMQEYAKYKLEKSKDQDELDRLKGELGDVDGETADTFVRDVEAIQKLRDENPYMEYFTYIPGDEKKDPDKKQNVNTAIQEVLVEGRDVYSSDYALISRTERDQWGRPTQTDYYDEVYEINPETGEGQWNHEKINKTTKYYDTHFGVVSEDRDYTFVDLPEERETETHEIMTAPKRTETDIIEPEHTETRVVTPERTETYEITPEKTITTERVVPKMPDLRVTTASDQTGASGRHRVAKAKDSQEAKEYFRTLGLDYDTKSGILYDEETGLMRGEAEVTGGWAYMIPKEPQKTYIYGVTEYLAGGREITHPSSDSLFETVQEEKVIPAVMGTRVVPAVTEEVIVPAKTQERTVEAKTGEIVRDIPYSTGANVNYDVNIYSTGKGHSPWAGASDRVTARDTQSGPGRRQPYNYAFPGAVVYPKYYSAIEKLAEMKVTGNMDSQEKEKLYADLIGLGFTDDMIDEDLAKITPEKIVEKTEFDTQMDGLVGDVHKYIALLDYLSKGALETEDRVNLAITDPDIAKKIDGIVAKFGGSEEIRSDIHKSLVSAASEQPALKEDGRKPETLILENGQEVPLYVVRQVARNAFISPDVKAMLDYKEAETLEYLSSDMVSTKDAQFYEYQRMPSGKTYAMPTWGASGGYNYDGSSRYGYVRGSTYDKNNINSMLGAEYEKAKEEGNIPNKEFAESVGVYNIQGTDIHMATEGSFDNDYDAVHGSQTNLDSPYTSDIVIKNMGAIPVIPLSDRLEGRVKIKPVDTGLSSQNNISSSTSTGENASIDTSNQSRNSIINNELDNLEFSLDNNPLRYETSMGASQ